MGRAATIEQDVGRLQIAVNHAALVSIMNGPRHVHHQGCRVALRQGSLGHAGAKRLPLDQLRLSRRIVADGLATVSGQLVAVSAKIDALKR